MLECLGFGSWTRLSHRLGSCACVPSRTVQCSTVPPQYKHCIALHRSTLLVRTVRRGSASQVLADETGQYRRVRVRAGEIAIKCQARDVVPASVLLDSSCPIRASSSQCLVFCPLPLPRSSRRLKQRKNFLSNNTPSPLNSSIIHLLPLPPPSASPRRSIVFLSPKIPPSVNCFFLEIPHPSYCVYNLHEL